MHLPHESQDRDPTKADARPVGQITRRLIYALALIPIVPAVATIGVSLTDAYFGLGPVDDLRWFHLFFSVLWVGVTVLIWRRVILWTLGRKWLTVLVSMIPFVQVAYGQPLWDAGCVSEDILRVGQHEIGIGLWIWLTVWVWWGWEKTQMSKDVTAPRWRKARMTPTAKRLAGSIATIPFVFGAFLVIGVALEGFLALSYRTPAAFAFTALIAILLWILLWRRAVVWSPGVVRGTLGLALLTLGAPIALQGVLCNVVDGLSEAIVVSLPIVGWGVWMAVTINQWPVVPSVPGDARVSPQCLKCGYLLIGLRCTRCPECGDEPTLDELWEATAGAV
jgi:hypothetical protein